MRFNPNRGYLLVEVVGRSGKSLGWYPKPVADWVRSTTDRDVDAFTGLYRKVGGRSEGGVGYDNMLNGWFGEEGS